MAGLARHVIQSCDTVDFRLAPGVPSILIPRSSETGLPHSQDRLGGAWGSSSTTTGKKFSRFDAFYACPFWAPRVCVCASVTVAKLGGQGRHYLEWVQSLACVGLKNLSHIFHIPRRRVNCSFRDGGARTDEPRYRARVHPPAGFR